MTGRLTQFQLLEEAGHYLNVWDPSPGVEDMVGADGGVDVPLHLVLQPAAVVRDVDEHAELAVVHVVRQGHAGIGRPHKNRYTPRHDCLTQPPR